jgi:uncharacterized delta-60 repeat protein
MLSPEGKLETVYDNRGNQLKLKDILIDSPREFGYLKTTTITCSSTSYFNLYFEPGCGMEDTSNPTHNARRAIICKVFEDISNFITSPLSSTGNKVNIWVRDFANENAPLGTLGLASSFYISTPNVGGILDGEIWKTIHLGVDSYTNVSGGTNLFYHGRVSFNFNDPSIQWNTNLSINTPSNSYDLYTVILHEVVHSLGFGSFINQNGESIDPFPYYSRYDTFLRTNTNLPLLTIGSSSMYDLSFNNAVSPTVLRPGCTLPDNLSNGVLNTTSCNNAIKYVGSSTVPVYTPTCFELGSSLGHFEDMLYPTCASPYGNDSYFVLSNVNLLGTTKRYLKPEERNVLCDIGYSVKTTFGVSTTVGGYFNYGGSTCAGITVAGLNDGINSNGDYTFVGNTNSNITINGATILNNDINATGFESLQDTNAISTLSSTTGTATTSINFSSAVTGLHVLRYVPINGTKRGNITYIYIYIRVPAITGGCSPTPSSCNLVMNGDFEQFSTLTTSTNIRSACGWDSVYQPPPPSTSGSASAQYFSSTYNPIIPNWNVPCNWFGFQPSNNNVGNSYAGLYISTGVGGKQHIYTTLKTPLQANTNYQLSFDVSLGESRSHWASNLQAFLHRSNATPPSILAYNSNGDVSIVNNASDTTTQLISPTVTRNTNGWDTITFNFTTTDGGEQFLYLGLLNNTILQPNTPSVTGIGGCNYSSISTNGFGDRLVGYYIDNVSLIPTNGAVFNLPTSICSTQNLQNLSIYLSGTTTNGVFSGMGVSFASGIYTFNAATAGVGSHLISYTFNNNLGCPITIYDSIVVSSTSTNTIVVDAVNDDFTTMPINTTTGGITVSVYTNDLYNGVASSATSISNVTFSLVSPVAITGATINNSGLISVPAGTPSGTYSIKYRLSAIGNCNATDTATVIIIVYNDIDTPNLVAGIRANNIVELIALQNSNKIIISGQFSTYNNISRNTIARLNNDLTLDNTFLCSANSLKFRARDIAIQANDGIIVVGSFSSYGGASNGNNIVRLLDGGNVDSSFNVGGVGTAGFFSNTNNDINSCAIQSDGSILIGGDFNFYNGINRRGIARLLPNGTIDLTFNPVELNNYTRCIVSNILIQPDGFILLEGIFNTTGISQDTKLIRINSQGNIDTTFTMGNDTSSLPLNNSTIGNFMFYDMALQSSGKIIIVGAFTKYNGVTTKNIIRLMPNGQIDPTFNIVNGVNRSISTVIIEPITDKIIIGGEFTSYGFTPTKKLIRLTANGLLDTTFSIGTGTTDSVPVPNCTYCSNRVVTLKQQPDEKIIVGGKFTTFNGLSATNITRISGSAGLQAKGSGSLEYQSEPEINTNPNYSGIFIYPNPSDGIFNIVFTEEKEPSTIKIYNLLGELVFTSSLSPEGQNQIDITNLASGYYIAHISTKTSTTQHKLIKK